MDSDTIELALDIVTEMELIQEFDQEVWVKIPKHLYEQVTGE